MNRIRTRNTVISSLLLALVAGVIGFWPMSVEAACPACTDPIYT
jgi:hypothetical protein